jgi:DNA helicase II / ATP-dependent DNA helicase PcrA
MASSNEAIIAAAGSGKTEYLLEIALADPSVRSLIVTYTNENLREINSRLWAKAGGLPPNVTTATWFEFLLRHGVKPYQSYKTSIGRIRSINFATENPPFAKRADFDSYYLDSADNVYRDAASDLAFVLDEVSSGKVINRLQGIYGKILIDEVQDLAGYDLEFLQLLLSSNIQVLMVGDPRQAVYLTNRSKKNSQFRGAKLVDWLAAREKDGLCVSKSMDINHRCNQTICDFADSVFPAMPNTKSGNLEELEHMGVVLVREDDLPAYRAKHDPQELRWNRSAPLAGPNARNYGEVKGHSFDRVLIHPTSPITEFIEKGSVLKEVAAAKFYVAVTRARHSVAIVTKKKTTTSAIPFWSPGDASSATG